MARVRQRLVDILFGIAGGQHVQVRNDQKCLILVLQAGAIFERAHVVAEMQFAGRPIACQDSGTILSDGHFITFVERCVTDSDPMPRNSGNLGSFFGAEWYPENGDFTRMILNAVL